MDSITDIIYCDVLYQISKQLGFVMGERFTEPGRKDIDSNIDTFISDGKKYGLSIPDLISFVSNYRQLAWGLKLCSRGDGPVMATRIHLFNDYFNEYLQKKRGK